MDRAGENECRIPDEIIIVDTGSKDQTKRIAQQWIPHVLDFQWNDDFSAARNYSFEQATLDYILWLDADDVLLPEDRLKFLSLKKSLNSSIDAVSMLYHTQFDENNNVLTTVRRFRLVKRSKGFRWYGMVIATVTVGDSPRDVAIPPDGSLAYVTNHATDNVSVINVNNNTVIATVTVGNAPVGVAITPDGTQAYVTNTEEAAGADNVSVINTANNTVVTTVTVGNFPINVAISPDGTRAYVTNQASGTVSVINTADNTVTDNVPVGSNPIWVTITPDGSRAYVSNFGDGTVSVINTAINTVVATVFVGNNPLGSAVTPDGSRVYVTRIGASNVAVINTTTNTEIASVNVGTFPSAVAVTPSCVPVVF